VRLAERLAPAAASLAVTDSGSVADTYEARYGCRIAWIPYGAELPDPDDAGWCQRLGLEPGRFVLFVGRLVPENNARLVVEAHHALGADWPLVVVGHAPYAEDYIAGLHARRRPRSASLATSSATATPSWSTAAASWSRRPRWAARTR
jgi:glycosyltransferase involved in cell wall biosynthesis